VPHQRSLSCLLVNAIPTFLGKEGLSAWGACGLCQVFSACVYLWQLCAHTLRATACMADRSEHCTSLLAAPQGCSHLALFVLPDLANPTINDG